MQVTNNLGTELEFLEGIELVIHGWLNHNRTIAINEKNSFRHL